MTLEDTARDKWRSSGLTDEHAAKLRLSALLPEETEKLVGVGVPALRLPYWRPDGSPSDFFRVRFLSTPSVAGFVAAKPQRYAQPAGSMNEVYLPPLLDESWAKFLADAATPLVVTEGELKAAAACSVGIPTIGLGGVDVWCATKRGVAMLPALASAAWERRDVVIAYDSDAASNPNVVRAQLRLAEVLVERGAIVKVASIPPGPRGEKQGLDDVLVARGPDALVEVLNNPVAYDEGRSLWEMNAELVYVRDPGIIIDLGRAAKVSPRDFTAHAYANRTYTEIRVAKDGGTTRTQKPLAPRWLSWPSRHELAGITYRPGSPEITEDHQYNEWKGWGCEPRKGSVAPWRWLLDYLFTGAPKEDRLWFERWCACPIQRPGTKLYSSAVLWGSLHGVGKSLVGECLSRVYGKNATTVGNEELGGSFNSWQKNKQLIIGEEITGSDVRGAADKLKALITQHVTRINEKYQPAYTVPDVTNYLFNSNHPDSFFLEDSDRRFFVHQITVPPAPFEKYRAVDEWLRSPDGPPALLHHLMHLPLGDFDARARAHRTASREAMILDNKSELGIWVSELLASPEVVLAAYSERAAAKCDLWTNKQLRLVYAQGHDASKVSGNGVGRELKRAGVMQVARGALVPLGSIGRDRLYVLRNQGKWSRAAVSTATKHWLSFWG